MYRKFEKNIDKEVYIVYVNENELCDVRLSGTIKKVNHTEGQQSFDMIIYSEMFSNINVRVEEFDVKTQSYICYIDKGALGSQLHLYFNPIQAMTYCTDTARVMGSKEAWTQMEFFIEQNK